MVEFYINKYYIQQFILYYFILFILFYLYYNILFHIILCYQFYPLYIIYPKVLLELTFL